MNRIGKVRFRAAALLGAAALAAAFAAAGGTAAPALAASSHAAARTAPMASPATVSSAAGCYNGGQLTLPDGNVLDAKGFGNPASIDEYTYNGGANQHWAECELSNGYDEIVSDYNGNLMCLNVEDGDYVSGEHLLAYPCDTSVTGNEQWRRPENTPVGDTGYNYLVPAGDYNLCVNVAGGLGSGRLMILYACSAVSNEEFIPGGSATVQDQLGMATLASSFNGYSGPDAPDGYCDRFSYDMGDTESLCGGGGNDDEEWCSDFAAYIWRNGGNVSFNFKGDNPENGYLSANSGGFYSYAVVKGTWHSATSGYSPEPGDVAVYGPLYQSSEGVWLASHVAVVIGVSPGNNGPNAFNGDDGYDGVDLAMDETASSQGDNLVGYASPPGL
jgi:hypothetical protein